jgi:mono/diheme cytochrome c family protein
MLTIVFRWLVVLALAFVPAAAQTPDPPLPTEPHLTEQNPLPRRHLQFEERGVKERDLFYVAYGDMLFHSPFVLGGRAQQLGLSCAACHSGGEANRQFFVPGLSSTPGTIDVSAPFFHPANDNHKFDPFDIPSLRGIRFTAPYGRDGRIASLREFTRMVIVQEFAGPEPTPFMLDALVAFMNELDFLPAPYLNRDGTLDDRATAAAKRGEILFNKPFPEMMGGKSCAACHIPSANFLDGRQHDIGSGRPSLRHARDSAYDTPTLLGTVNTAPYFHDGSLDTLADVVFWFDSRYGLGLSKAEQADLTAYLEAVGTGEDPFEARPRETLLQEQTTAFLSVLDTLIPRRDAAHAVMALRTVALLTRGAGQAKEAERLETMARAADGANWPELERLWAAYRGETAN